MRPVPRLIANNFYYFSFCNSLLRKKYFFASNSPWKWLGTLWLRKGPACQVLNKLCGIFFYFRKARSYAKSRFCVFSYEVTRKARSLRKFGEGINRKELEFISILIWRLRIWFLLNLQCKTPKCIDRINSPKSTY